MRENRLNGNPQANGNLKDDLSLSYFFVFTCSQRFHPIFKFISPFPPPPHTHPPRLKTWRSCHVFLFFMSFAEWFYCKLRTWNGTWVCELYGTKPLFRKHCKAMLFPIPVTMSVLYFQSAVICSDFSDLTPYRVHVLMNSLPFCVGYTWTEATVLYQKT